MSKEKRAKKRKTKKRRIWIILSVILIAVLLIVYYHYRSSKVNLVEKGVYRDTYQTDVYFFKDIAYMQLDGFDQSALTVAEGSKVNGYMQLTKTPLVVNSDYLKFQIQTIDMIINDAIYKDWAAIMNEIGENFVGTSKVQSQINGTEANSRKNFLVNATRYMGYSVEQLNALKDKLEALNDGTERQITLSGLGMLSSGYIFSRINSMEKIISERVLPYVNSNILDKVSKIDQQDSIALKVINNDHIFAALQLAKAITIQDTEAVLKLKEEYFGTRDTSKNSDYFSMLVKRVDLLRTYPTAMIEKDNKSYEAYIVDVIPSNDQNIMILMLKDYVNEFATDNILKMPVSMNEYNAYVVDDSAVWEKDGQYYIKEMNTGLFVKDIPVVVGNFKDGKVYLPIRQNEKITKDMSYKVYP